MTRSSDKKADDNVATGGLDDKRTGVLTGPRTEFSGSDRGGRDPGVQQGLPGAAAGPDRGGQDPGGQRGLPGVAAGPDRGQLDPGGQRGLPAATAGALGRGQDQVKCRDERDYQCQTGQVGNDPLAGQEGVGQAEVQHDGGRVDFLVLMREFLS